MKLCKDCHYHKSHDIYRTGNGYYDECTHPELKSPPCLVTGRNTMTFCHYERLDNRSCGPDAKYFEPRRPPEKPEDRWARIFNFGSSK